MHFETMKEFVLWLSTMNYDLVDLLVDFHRFTDASTSQALEDEMRRRHMLKDIYTLR